MDSNLFISSKRQKIFVVALHIKDSFRSEELKLGLEGIQEEVIFFEGLDARRHQIPSTWQSNHLAKFLYGRNLTPGEIACTFGHSEIVKSMVSRVFDWVLILEDNVKFNGIESIISFLKCFESNSASLINFFSDPEYDLISSSNDFNDFTIQKTRTIPIRAKCYALNKDAVQKIGTGYAKYGFSGFQADFPIFYLLSTKFYILKNSPILIEKSISLIGNRKNLEINNALGKIWNGFIFLLFSNDMQFSSRFKILILGFKMKFYRKFFLNIGKTERKDE